MATNTCTEGTRAWGTEPQSRIARPRYCVESGRGGDLEARTPRASPSASDRQPLRPAAIPGAHRREVPLEGSHAPPPEEPRPRARGSGGAPCGGEGGAAHGAPARPFRCPRRPSTRPHGPRTAPARRAGVTHARVRVAHARGSSSCGGRSTRSAKHGGQRACDGQARTRDGGGEELTNRRREVHDLRAEGKSEKKQASSH